MLSNSNLNFSNSIYCQQGWELYAAHSDFVRCAACFNQLVYIRTALLTNVGSLPCDVVDKPVQRPQTHSRWLHCISAGQCFYKDMRFALTVKARTAAHHSAYNPEPWLSELKSIWKSKFILVYIRFGGEGWRVFRISDIVKTLMEHIFNPCGEFRWSPEGPVSQIHSPHLLVGALGSFQIF